MDTLIGSWALVSWDIAEPGSDAFAPLWPNATGSLIYTREGMMSALVGEPGWMRDGAPPQTGFREGLIAYSGRYSFADDIVSHHVTVSNIRSWIGTDMRRRTVFGAENHLILTTEETTDTSGVNAIHRIRWQRRDLHSTT